MRTISYTGFFIICFFATTFVVNLLWYLFVYRTLYYCSDPLFFPLMFPPYAHEGAPGDYYAVNPLIVNTLGIVFLIANFAIPVMALKYIRKGIKDKF